MKKMILLAACLLSSAAIAKSNRITVNCDGTTLTVPLYQDIKIGNNTYELLVSQDPGIYLLMNVVDGSYQRCSGPARAN